jgi:hypothetical protein
VVAVAVGVRDDQGIGRASVAGEPLRDEAVNRGPQRHPPRVGNRAGVQQQRPVVAEQQVHKRRLVRHRLALPEHERVLVEPVDL